MKMPVHGNLYEYAAALDQINTASGRGIPASFWGESGFEGFWAPEKSKTAHTLATTGYYNKIYGGDLVAQVLYSDSLFSILPKVPYEKSGHRVIEAQGMSTGVGQALGGALQTAAVPTYSQELYTTPALQTNTVDINLEAQHLAGKDDIITPEEVIRIGVMEFKNGMDYALGLDCNTLASAGTYLESIERLGATTAGVVTNHSYTAGDEDFMGVDRSGNSWFDGYMNENSGTDRVFQLSYLEDVYANIEPYADGPGGFNLVNVTGFNTGWRINQAAGPAIYHPKEDYSVSLNGLSTQKGTAYNIRIPSVHGYPLFLMRANLASDTITRVYTYNQDYCGIKMLVPPAVLDSDNPLINGYFLRRNVNWMMGQLFSLKSKAHGMIWDLK